MSAYVISGMANAAGLREGAEHRQVGARRQVEHAHDDRCRDHGDEDAWYTLAISPFSSRITASVPAPTRNAVQLVRPSSTALAMASRFLTGPSLSIENPKIFGQLTDQYGQGNAVHVSIADRLRKEFSDEPQARHARQNADGPGYDRHHAGQGDGTRGLAARPGAGRRRG